MTVPSEQPDLDGVRTYPRPEETDVVPITDLRPADSPRANGENLEHASLIAEADHLPPILVQRATMRVVDGMHRLRAAVLRGMTTIQVRYFDGHDEAAFVRAVQENVTHGLPLSLADRRAAAARIIRSHPTWSDRAISSTVGLSDKTVAVVRRQVTGPDVTDIRVGRDGRRRPVDSAERRRLAGEFIMAHPDASLREVARAAGISPTTVRKVREEIRTDEHRAPVLRLVGSEPEPPAEPPAEPPTGSGETCGTTARPDHTVSRTLHLMRRDPSLRMTEVGRALLRRVTVVAAGPRGLTEFVPRLPPHSLYLLIDLALSCAEAWHDFARRLEQRVRVSE